MGTIPKFEANAMNYKTKQQEILLDYLKSAEGRHLTAGDVCEHFKAQGLQIGKSTVYRRLEGLVTDGILKKYTVDNQASACFEYVGEDKHLHGGCFHLKCEKCGKLFHLHCEEIEALNEHISADHDFMIDPTRTVFYGVCGKCR